MSDGNRVLVVIPARYGSKRFPGKPLAEIAGVPMVVRVLRRAQRVRNASRVVVATDDGRISRVVTSSGGEVVMTSRKHPSGTSRSAEVAGRMHGFDVVVNIQGDEPLFPVAGVERLIEEMLSDRGTVMATLASRRISPEELRSPDVVKVVCDREGYALYFSRAPIPWNRRLHEAAQGLDVGRGAAGAAVVGGGKPAAAGSPGVGVRGAGGGMRGGATAGVLRHIGIYAFRRRFLLEYPKLPRGRLERAESLEQLRALENGYRIKVIVGNYLSTAVDRPSDIKMVEKKIQKG